MTATMLIMLILRVAILNYLEVIKVMASLKNHDDALKEIEIATLIDRNKKGKQ